METEQLRRAEPQSKTIKKEEKTPDDSFRKLMEEEEKENKTATFPTPFDIMTKDAPIMTYEVSNDSTISIELVHKLLDRMTFQVDNGIETTTISLGEDSIFSNAEITLTHYDTAPDSFHISFDCEPQIVETVADHLPQLKKHLEKHCPKFRYRFGTPQIKALKN